MISPAVSPGMYSGGIDMTWLLLWFPLSILAGAVAGNKGRSGFGFFLLALILSPLIGLLAALVIAPNTVRIEAARINRGEARRCPACAELIRREAVICRFCGTGISPLGPISILHKHYGLGTLIYWIVWAGIMGTCVMILAGS
jgi:hypothetical protein